MIERHFGIGGWSVAEECENYLEYGEVYKNTVKALLEHFSKTPSTMISFSELLDKDVGAEALKIHSFGLLPVIFLFRHYIELKLKGLILLKRDYRSSWNLRVPFISDIKLKTHDIGILLKELKSISKTPIDFGIPLKGRISFETEDFINEIQKRDKNSDGFRYPYDTKGEKFFQGEFLFPPDFLRKINTLSNLKDIVLKVMEDLENIEGDFEQEKENRENQADIA